MRSLSGITDYYLIATGTSIPHIKALANALERSLKEEGLRPHRKAGIPESEWMAIDYINFIVHLFSSQTRQYYDIERLWNDAVRVD